MKSSSNPFLEQTSIKRTFLLGVQNARLTEYKSDALCECMLCVKHEQKGLQSTLSALLVEIDRPILLTYS